MTRGVSFQFSGSTVIRESKVINLCRKSTGSVVGHNFKLNYYYLKIYDK